MGFCQFTCHEAAGEAPRCRGLLEKWLPPLYPVAPVCWCLSLYACVSACLQCGFLCLFVIWTRVAGLAGG